MAIGAVDKIIICIHKKFNCYFSRQDINRKQIDEKLKNSAYNQDSKTVISRVWEREHIRWTYKMGLTAFIIIVFINILENIKWVINILRFFSGRVEEDTRLKNHGRCSTSINKTILLRVNTSDKLCRQCLNFMTKSDTIVKSHMEWLKHEGKKPDIELTCHDKNS